ELNLAESHVLQEMNQIYQTTINILKKFYLPIIVIFIIFLISIIIVALPPSTKQSIIDFIQATK
ncbi:MAG: hypothetical protein Q8O17_01420, partial [Candidatus Methanoperedens sp.]|nr:hypothetical protein [Candidatus Methanoperedens sp.]